MQNAGYNQIWIHPTLVFYKGSIFLVMFYVFFCCFMGNGNCLNYSWQSHLIIQCFIFSQTSSRYIRYQQKLTVNSFYSLCLHLTKHLCKTWAIATLHALKIFCTAKMRLFFRLPTSYPLTHSIWYHACGRAQI